MTFLFAENAGNLGKNENEPSQRDDENRSAKNEGFSISVETPEMEKSIREFCPHLAMWSLAKPNK